MAGAFIVGQGSSMEADSAKTSGEKDEHAKKRNDEKKMKRDGTGGSMQHDDQMDQGKM